MVTKAQSSVAVVSCQRSDENVYNTWQHVLGRTCCVLHTKCTGEQEMPPEKCTTAIALVFFQPVRIDLT